MNGHTWDGHTRIFVVKIASRCNLSCSYCYMYHHADQSWKHQPLFISDSAVRDLGLRLDEHARGPLCGGRLMVVAHGGEPLLYPRLDWFFDTIKQAVTSGTVEFAIQTNGTLLQCSNLGILKKHAVRIGISVDGSRTVHNRFRVNHTGYGSYDAVLTGLRLARDTAPELLDSVLQVIDLSVHPKQMLDTLESYGVQRADLLFPDLNYDTLPSSGMRPGMLGEWLCAVFDEWVERHDGVHIRIFVTIMRLLLGRMNGTDQLGAFSDGALMVETDGSYHIHDGLKTSFEGAGCTGMTVKEQSILEVESLPLARSFRNKASGASRECLECNRFPVCGGGTPIHRYSAQNGFNRPSVYCLDLKRLIDHIRQYLSMVRPNSQLVC